MDIFSEMDEWLRLGHMLRLANCNGLSNRTENRMVAAAYILERKVAIVNEPNVGPRLISDIPESRERTMALQGAKVDDHP